MRRIFALLLMLLLLAGCGSEPEPMEPTQPTEPPAPWTEEAGMAWDRAGVMLEMPLNIPDGLHYTEGAAFDGDLLLWSLDTHLSDVSTLELCLVELDDGSVIAQRDIPLQEYVIPQVLGDTLYLCDRTGGTVMKLNKSLRSLHEWKIEPGSGDWYMGEGEVLYQIVDGSSLRWRDLTNGQTGIVLEEDPEVSWISVNGSSIVIQYYRSDTGAETTALLDLETGDVTRPEFGGTYTSISRLDDLWLCEKFVEGYVHYIYREGEPVRRIPVSQSTFTLLPEGYLLEATTDGVWLRLYDTDGKLISACEVFESGSGYLDSSLIWNETLGGYFVQIRSFDETNRLLYWDVTKSAGGEDLEMSDVPPADEAQVQLEQRAKELGEQYGLTVLVGENCDTVFDDFTASHVTDWERVTAAMDVLEKALSVYPAGFIDQLRYDNIRGIQIQLVCDLWADGNGRYGDGYAAFTQPMWDHYLMVMDIDDTTTDSYYHEFSHIIDSYLYWDSCQRSDALYSEDGWARCNPDWFPGYSCDYSNPTGCDDYTCFIDDYSTISPTEDRARVLENAMAGYAWEFENAPVLEKKLDYYCRCIRDAFDTTGWPDTVLWEEPLA